MKVEAVFGSVSCVPSQALPPTPYECEATGWYLNGATFPALAESSNGQKNGGQWFSGSTVPAPPQNNQVTLPNEVSCATVPAQLPECLFVGSHYNFNGKVEQLAEWRAATSFVVVNWRNPAGATFSGLDDVACPSDKFCVTTGFAGKGKTYHATWFTWNGREFRQKNIPEPPHSHNSQLGGLSCATTSNCVAVGDYQTPANNTRSYAEIWAHGKWKIVNTPNVAGQKASFFQAISCNTATTCVAVGESAGPGAHPFAETWNGTKWRISKTPPRSNAALFGVSCPASTTCFAVGSYKAGPLILRWNGSSWVSLKGALTPKPFNAQALLHVSCVSATSCAAVGYRYDAKVGNSQKTLAEQWNGVRWKLNISQNN